MRRISMVGLALIWLVAAGCSGSSSPTGPTAPVIPDVAGAWTGWLEAGNWSQTMVDVQNTQTGATVNGTWRAASASQRDWEGTITGAVSASAFTGTATISMPHPSGDGTRCTGTSSITGPVSGTLRWTGPGFSGGCNGLPTSVVFVLNRR